MYFKIIISNNKEVIIYSKIKANNNSKEIIYSKTKDSNNNKGIICSKIKASNKVTTCSKTKVNSNKIIIYSKINKANNKTLLNLVGSLTSSSSKCKETIIIKCLTIWFLIIKTYFKIINNNSSSNKEGFSGNNNSSRISSFCSYSLMNKAKAIEIIVWLISVWLPMDYMLK